jgi:hypothetical protein
LDRGGEILCLREDIGRHNAIDMSTAHAFLRGSMRDLLIDGPAGLGGGDQTVRQLGIPWSFPSPYHHLAVDGAQAAGIT